MRLAQNDSRYHHYCHAGPDYPSSRRLHLQSLRRRPALCLLKASRNHPSQSQSRCQNRLDKPLSCESSSTINPVSSCSSFSLPPRSSTSSCCSHKPPAHPTSSSLPLTHLSAQAESRYFHSLPSKIQQKYFSPEERAYLRQAYRQSVIVDAADEAVYRPEKETREPEDTQSVDTLVSTGTTDAPPRLSRSSAFYLEDSGSDSDSDSGWDTGTESDDDSDNDNDGGMDESLYDSFRWLDEDGDLDLTLDEYHNHIVNTVPKVPPRRKPSFRRTMTFNAVHRAHKATSSVSSVPTSSHSSTVPSSLAHIVGRNSTSRPPSGQQRPVLHVPRASTSSIDPSAQYYQDPEARLKLRVYLASPQKFDEAVEFGFPALDDSKEDNTHPEKVAEYTRPAPKVQKVTGTFFEDEDGAVHGHRLDKAQRKSSRLSAIKGPQSPAFPTTKRQSVSATHTPTGPGAGPGAGAGLRRLPGNREMTLKMTLTRPDLRTDSPSASPTSAEDPLKLDELPPADTNPQTWDWDSDQQNVMKKMWRKLRKQKC